MHPTLRRLVIVLATLGLPLVALVFSVGLAEIVVRTAWPQQLILVRADVWQPVDSLGWAKRPNLETTINTGERTVALVTDSLGLRIPASGRTLTRSSAKRILLLGDSFMEALQVEYEQSVAGLLEARASRSLGTPVEVWNSGVAGWGPSQYMLLARSLLDRFTFDYVLVALYVGNDAVLRKHDYFRPRSPTVVHHLRLPRALSVAEFRQALFYPLNDFLERRSHVFIMLKTATENFRAKLGVGGPEFPYEIRRSEATSSRWAVTADIGHDLAQLADAHGVPLVFVLLPSVYQVDTTVARQFAETFGLDRADVDLEQPNRLMQDALEARGVRAIDALPVLREAYGRGESLFGAIDQHFSPTGHEALADLLLPSLLAVLGDPKSIEPTNRVDASRRILSGSVLSQPPGAR
jgi:hypothetical protein